MSVLLEYCRHGGHAPFIGRAKALEPIDPAIQSPACRPLIRAYRGLGKGRSFKVPEKLHDYSLDESRGLLSGAIGDPEKLLANAWLSGNPPKSASRRNSFGERVQPNDSPVPINAQKARNKLIKEPMASGFAAHGSRAIVVVWIRWKVG